MESVVFQLCVVVKDLGFSQVYTDTSLHLTKQEICCQLCSIYYRNKLMLDQGKPRTTKAKSKSILFSLTNFLPLFGRIKVTSSAFGPLNYLEF